MLAYIAAIGVGFALLLWGADRFVTGASALARTLGVSPLVIGLTVVGFGTSAPEMLVSAVAAWQGSPGIAVGNALGSNITNVGLVLGLTALVTPLAVRSETLRREFPILLAIMLVVLLLLLDGEMARWNGLVLLAGMGWVAYWMVSLGLREAADPMAGEYEQELPPPMPLARALLWLALGLALLLVSSRMLVWGAVGIAEALGVSDLVIGLTVVAIGTSLPELAASLVGALKGEHDIAIGNVLGSNMFNLLAVLGIAGALAPHTLDPQVLTRDFAVMAGFTLALFAMAFGFRRQGRINRLEGALLFAAYGVYVGVLYQS
ncbi:calcium/sodium antiporter [Ectothiorhodospiraceae bacterium 2226]|nr:calcium/sodium antiporter [Ectothiorhodospiraceae bacterium 2226]